MRAITTERVIVALQLLPAPESFGGFVFDGVTYIPSLDSAIRHVVTRKKPSRKEPLANFQHDFHNALGALGNQGEVELMKHADKMDELATEWFILFFVNGETDQFQRAVMNFREELPCGTETAEERKLLGKIRVIEGVHIPSWFRIEPCVVMDIQQSSRISSLLEHHVCRPTHRGEPVHCNTLLPQLEIAADQLLAARVAA